MGTPVPPHITISCIYGSRNTAEHKVERFQESEYQEVCCGTAFSKKWLLKKTGIMAILMNIIMWKRGKIHRIPPLVKEPQATINC